jgi:moderate conductance mechanosensitive channel
LLRAHLRSDRVMRRRKAIVVLLAFVLSQSAFAQTPATTDALIEAAKKSGSTVIVITPDSAKDPAAPAAELVATDAIQEVVAGTTSEIRRIVNGWDELAAAARSAIAAHGQDGSVAWVIPTALLGLALIGIGALVAWLLARWVRGYFAAGLGLSPATRVERLLRLFAAAIIRLVLLIVLLAVPLIIGAFLWPGDVAWRVMMTSFLLTAALIGSVWIAMAAVLAPSEPHLRVVPLTDAESRRLFLHIMIAATVGVVVLGFCRWMLHLGVPRETLKPGVVLATFVTAAGFSVVAVANRNPVGRVIAGQAGSAPWRRKLARIWPALAILYFTFAFLVSAVRTLLDRPNALGLVGFPILILIAAFAVYGVALVFVDLFVARREAVARANQLKEVDAGLRESISTASSDFSLLRRLLERSAAVVAFVVGFYLLAKLWGIDRYAGEAVTAAVIQIAIVLLIAYIGYHAARLWVDRRIAGEVHRAASGGVPGGHASSRMATLLPIFRNFLLITIGVITTLVVLSRLGVDIGPLLAGAGVVGLAVGFGAQTLVKDIISGAFFLMDDAFRIGEYIDIGSGKGTVEKISVRSMQLRHQDGPLNTVPFGSIDKVNNFSRDWAIMKIPLRVTYDTDAEHVRKLVRKLGEELVADPEFGKQFLEPLKSQGIVGMEDSAMIIRVKFMTKPGDQSEIRKVVYARIRELFLREGIQFAQKEVRVRIAEGPGADAPSAQQRAAATAAAEAVVDEDVAAAAKAGRA